MKLLPLLPRMWKKKNQRLGCSVTQQYNNSHHSQILHRKIPQHCLRLSLGPVCIDCFKKLIATLLIWPSTRHCDHYSTLFPLLVTVPPATHSSFFSFFDLPNPNKGLPPWAFLQLRPLSRDYHHLCELPQERIIRENASKCIGLHCEWWVRWLSLANFNHRNSRKQNGINTLFPAISIYFHIGYATTCPFSPNNSTDSNHFPFFSSIQHLKTSSQLQPNPPSGRSNGTQRSPNSWKISISHSERNITLEKVISASLLPCIADRLHCPRERHSRLLNMRSMFGTALLDEKRSGEIHVIACQNLQVNSIAIKKRSMI